MRERIWFDKFMQVIAAPFDALPWAVDAAFFAAAMMLGYAAMRIIAGPVRSDRLARTP
ncbi:MAG TPA: hypothetical protein VGK96_00345 [Candidatus Sulfotelmatobacter sp.]